VTRVIAERERSCLFVRSDFAWSGLSQRLFFELLQLARALSLTLALITTYPAAKRYASADGSSTGEYRRCSHLANASEAAPATALFPR